MYGACLLFVDPALMEEISAVWGRKNILVVSKAQFDRRNEILDLKKDLKIASNLAAGLIHLPNAPMSVVA
jgi:hypothetical protein